MSNLTIFGTIAFVAVVALLRVMFGLTGDPDFQMLILGSTETLVAFVAGGVAGGIGATRAAVYLKVQGVW